MTSGDDITHGLRCIFCSHTGFRLTAPILKVGTSFDAIACTGCEETYDVIDGAPFLCEFERSDFPRLPAIFAETSPPRGVPLEVARVFLGLLGSYHGAADKPGFLRDNLAAFTDILPDATADAIAGRIYPEWAHWDAMLGGASLDGQSVLVVDADTGFNAVRFLDKGAAVTCVERWPDRLAIGRAQVPAARWIGGAAHRLPFTGESFDLVYVDGTVDHGAKLRGIVREAVRVLRPRGRLLLTGVETHDEAEPGGWDTRILADDRVSSPSFTSLSHPFLVLGDAVSLAIIADPGDDGRVEGLIPIGHGDLRDGWVPAQEENLRALSESCVRAGILAIRTGPSAPPPALRTPGGIRPSWLQSWLQDERNGLSRLLAWAPSEATVNEAGRPLQQPTRACRTRARWLHHVRTGDEKPRLQARSLGEPLTCVLRANAETVSEHEIGTEWTVIDIAETHGSAGDVVLWDFAATTADAEPSTDPTFEIAVLEPADLAPAA